jgi:predicted TIM-barrel fold metal-dependent hydrolase
MPYAEGRVYYDSDSHIMEPIDWLTSCATEQEAKLIDRFDPASAGAAGDALVKLIERAERRIADPEATRELLEKPIISGPKGWLAYGACEPGERSKALDLLGFDRQLVFPTFALSQFARSQDHDVLYAGANALTRGMAEFGADDDRMLPVGFVPLNDPAKALEVIELGLRGGIGAFWVSSDPAGDRSPSHVDFHPIWERISEAGVPIMLHIGGARLLPRPYHNTGHPKTTDWLGGGENLRGKDYPAVAHSPQNFLTSMVLDGVFQRFPALRCGVIELGGTWVPSYLRVLDQAAHTFRKTEPLIKGLDLTASDYIRRQVRFSLFPFEDAAWLIREAGEDLFMFASDYPHPEGSKDPIGRFAQSLEEGGVSASAQDRFYSGNFADLMGLPHP